MTGLRGPRTSVVPALLVLAVLSGACGSGDTSTTTAATTTTAAVASLPFALVRSEPWRLHEAVDYRGDEPVATITRPYMDWYAEYKRSWSEGATTIVATVVLSGHRDAFDDVRSSLEALEVRFRTAPAGTRSVLVGRTDRSPVVLIDGTPVLMLSGTAEVSEDDLLAVAAAVERVDVDTWTAAGGRPG